MKIHVLFLLLWLVLAYGLCLMPGPGYWETRLPDEPQKEVVQQSKVPSVAPEDAAAVIDSDRVLRSLLTEDLRYKEWFGHFVPMLGLTFCLFTLLIGCQGRFIVSVLTTLLVAGFVAFSIEWLQELLPKSFSRGYSVRDIEVAMLAAFFGIWTAFATRRCTGCRQ